jgi:monoamine oxidase
MARTPLMSYLLRSYYTVRWAKKHGIPLDEARELHQSLLTRRRVLQYGAGAGVLGLWGCGTSPNNNPDGGIEPDAGTPDAGTMPLDTKVAIVGAGMAGLHCAYRLKKRGLIANVYDGAKRFGGRLFTDRNTFGDGLIGELGGEFIDSGHRVTRDLAAELGITLADNQADSPSVATLTAYFGGKKLTDQEILAGFTPIAAKMDQAFSAFTDVNLWPNYKNPNGATALDNTSIRAWFNQQNIPASDPVRQLIEVAYLGEYGLEPDVSPILNVLWLISTETNKFDIFGGSDERFYASEGNDGFTTKLAAGLDAAQINLESRLVALKTLSDNRYELTFDRGASTFTVKAEHVVLALPFTMLRQVQIDSTLPTVKKKAIAELSYGTNAKLLCGVDNRVWRTQHASNGSVFSDLAFQETWEAGRMQPQAQGVMTQYVGGTLGANFHTGTPEERATAFLNELDTVFPGVKAAHNGKVARFAWPQHEFTKGSYAAYSLGQFTTISGAEGERVGNLHFCGEHTSADSQGYIEGAAETGASVAQAVAMALGLP